MHIQGIEKGDIVASVPRELEEGTYEVSVRLPRDGDDEVFTRPQLLRVKPVWWAVAIACAPVLLVGALLAFLLRQSQRQDQRRHDSLWSLVLMEPENRTYSLSRAQFVMWSAAITCAYVFIFLARGIVENVWTFPPLAGFGSTFLLSLGTLVAAQATTRVVGAKGAGQPQPALADLVLHGGVLALERVQQLLWTFIAIGMFLFIVYTSYTTATELPTIPDELLTLMGISSGGYLAGKMARSAGPIIGRVRVSSGSVVLTIDGKRLSRDAVILVDDAQPELAPSVSATDLGNTGFARALTVTLEGDADKWKEQPHSITVINTDCQRAEWRSAGAITATRLIQAEGDLLELEIVTEYAGEIEGWELVGQARFEVSPQRDDERPRVFRARIRAAAGHRSGQIKAFTTRGEAMEAFWTAGAAPAQVSPAANPSGPATRPRGGVV
jgi:hypothetical protein